MPKTRFVNFEILYKFSVQTFSGFDGIFLKKSWSKWLTPLSTMFPLPPMFLRLRMESDRIRMESDPNSTFYHILTRIRIRIRMLSDTMQNWCLEFGYGFGYLLDLEHSYIHLFYTIRIKVCNRCSWEKDISSKHIYP